MTDEEREAQIRRRSTEGEWIAWSGGECPVPAGTQTEVRWRHGTISDVRAECVDWQHGPHYGATCDLCPSDIVAYRVVPA